MWGANTRDRKGGEQVRVKVKERGRERERACERDRVRESAS